MRIQFLSALVAVSAIGAAAAPAAEYNNKGSLSTINGARSLVARRFAPEAFNRRLADFKRDDDDDDDDDDDEDEDEDSDSSSGAVPTSSASYGSPMITSAPPVSSAAGGSGSVTTTLPASSGTSTLSAVKTIAAGETFDGKMVMYDRGVSCTGQEEGDDSDAVFEIEDGGSLSNVIIGPNQIEGVHCYGACTLTNVWWSSVCEDAFTIKEQEDGKTTTITGGGAFDAEDKVLQHDGGGTLQVSGFYVENFGKVYRSCGNCDDMPTRHVVMENVYAVEGSEIVGINANYDDTATLRGITVSGVDDICVTYEGNSNGDEPTESGSGPDGTNCKYSNSDITQQS
ncbi:pectate lyase [Aspergillus chevalieri]|uniref:Pectate lyase n=1 Tax=Aspergillus chevalieri TaxID=182096 RepID=A0A7R7ZRX7_ASPCH|nr:uncharacterized protein ACHE_61015S [Aspergillus chevalieri]BCR91129.1 hypothetical protein ACHE_61015S [Aspergillus chevalieri]